MINFSLVQSQMHCHCFNTQARSGLDFVTPCKHHVVVIICYKETCTPQDSFTCQAASMNSKGGKIAQVIFQLPINCSSRSCT